MLAWTIYISFAGALVAALLPKGKPELARWFALCVGVAGLAIAAFGFASWSRPAGAPSEATAISHKAVSVSEPR